MKLIPKKTEHGWSWKQNSHYMYLRTGIRIEVIRPLFKPWICFLIGHTLGGYEYRCSLCERSL